MEDMRCPYEVKCKEKYPEDTNANKEICDCIGCALCDHYWEFYDNLRLEEYKKKNRR